MYTLIIVDDDELIRKGLQLVIQWEKIGFCVKGAFPNATAAMDFLKSNAVDAILTDIKMPEMSGLEFIENAKAYHKNVKSIVISGYSDFEYARKALSLKVEDYLLKPLGEEEIETAFLKLKTLLDEDRQQNSGEKEHTAKPEYLLIKHLDNLVRMERPFRENETGKTCYEMILIQMKERAGIIPLSPQLPACTTMVKQVLQDTLFHYTDGLFAVLIPPQQLNGILMHFKREFPKYSNIWYQILIGQTIYSENELAPSYWSAIDLTKKETQPGIVHYERERNQYKKEWDTIQRLKNQMIENMEGGNFQNIRTQIDQINAVLAHYESKDSYYFYCNIIVKLLKYFDLENKGTLCFFANRHFSDVEKEYPHNQKLRENFAHDIESIRKSLWENSDSMKGLIVAKAKTLIESNYSDRNLSLATIANELNISYGYLSTIFTKIVGYSFKTYLVEVRMEKARTLLLSRNYRIYEIAELVGYRNPRYFTDAFKKHFNCSPADYISRFRGETIL